MYAQIKPNGSDFEKRKIMSLWDPLEKNKWERSDPALGLRVCLGSRDQLAYLPGWIDLCFMHFLNTPFHSSWMCDVRKSPLWGVVAPHPLLGLWLIPRRSSSQIGKENGEWSSPSFNSLWLLAQLHPSYNINFQDVIIVYLQCFPVVTINIHCSSTWVP